MFRRGFATFEEALQHLEEALQRFEEALQRLGEASQHCEDTSQCRKALLGIRTPPPNSRRPAGKAFSDMKEARCDMMKTLLLTPSAENHASTSRTGFAGFTNLH